MHNSFINAANYRHAKRALYLCIIAIVVYVIHDPKYPPNGGTWLGYTLGGLSFVLMIWLMLLGWRKRRYRSGGRPMVNWLSAHVYLGTALLLLMTLHSGFQFGINLHTLAYVLTAVVIVSGFYGVYAYLRYPRAMTNNLDSQDKVTVLQQIAQLDQQCLDLAAEIGGNAPKSIEAVIRATKIGGHAKDLLSSRLKRFSMPKEINELFDAIRKAESRAHVEDMMQTMAFGAVAASNEGNPKSEHMHKLVDAMALRKQLLDRVDRDIRFKVRLDVWLYIHVPIAFAALAAVMAHIFSVFFYW